MSYKGVEKKCRGDVFRPHAGNYASVLKKKAVRLDRRLAKRDPENAPTKRAYFGYSI